MTSRSFTIANCRRARAALTCVLGLAWAGAVCAAETPQRVFTVSAGVAARDDAVLRWTPYRRFSRHDGLPRNWISALVQHGDGYVYAGTEEGLARYDGQRWQPFALPVARQPYINALATSDDGALWVATDAGLFVLRDGRGEAVFATSPDASMHVHALLAQAGRGVWLGTPRGAFLCSATGCSEAAATRGLDVTRLLPAGSDALYLGTEDRGVLRLEDTQGVARLSTWSLASRDGLPDGAVTALTHWGGRDDGDLWIGTARGVARLGGGRLVVYGTASGFPDGASDFLRVAQRDGSSRLLAALPNSGLAEFAEDGSWRRLTTANGLPENSMNTLLLTDVDQPAPVLWLGSAHNGVLRAEPRQWTAFTERDGLPNRFVSAIGEAQFPDGHEALWIGTSEGSVRWDGAGWRPWLPPPYTAREVYEVLAQDDALWVATREGLLQVTPQGVREYTTANSALPDNAVIGLHRHTVGVDAGLWLGTRRGAARLRAGNIEAISPPIGTGGFHVRLFRSTAEPDGTSTLWAGAEQGLYFRDGGAWRATDCPALAGSAVFDLRERGTPGHDHLLWVATFDGLVRIDLDRGHACAPLSAAPASSVYQLQFDARDRVYLFGAYGVLRLALDAAAPGGYTFDRFDLADGLPDLEFTRASLRDAQGRIWAGSLEGATMYDPAAETPPASPRPLRVLATDDIGAHPLREGADLRTDASGVAFDLRLLSYQRDHRVRYRTQLAGLEAQPGDWNDVPHRSYSRLPAGAYEFRAWARDADGVESGPLVWHFRVHAPWWRQTWAFVACALALVLLGLWVGRLLARALARRAQALEREVAERTRALADANRQLEHASLTDPLTGLWNRRYFSVAVAPQCEQLAQSANAPGAAVVLLDVDHFKRINDRHGHATGDAVLLEFAQRIRAGLRSGDVALRWGGEEFLLVLRDVARENAGVLARRLQGAVGATPFHVSGMELDVTCSGGWAPYPFRSTVSTLDDVVALADAALYRAKEAGRNCVVGAVASAADGVAFVVARDPLE